MSIRAVLKDGVIRPLDPLAAGWVDGQALTIDSNEVELSQTPPKKEELDAWQAELDRMISEIAPEDHAELQRVMEEVEAESKAAVRREWGLE